MTLDILSRLLNCIAIVCLIYGFKCNCLFLYVGTILVIFSEFSTWICVVKFLNKINSKEKKLN